MDRVLMVIMAVLIGGFVIAVLFAVLNRKSGRGVVFDPFARDGASSDIINYTRIRVAGIGGLGLVAMAVAVAIYVPRIGQSLAIGSGLGVLFAIILIVWRKRAGPLPSSRRRAGANTSLSIDSPQSSVDDGRSHPRT